MIFIIHADITEQEQATHKQVDSHESWLYKPNQREVGIMYMIGDVDEELIFEGLY